MKQDEEGPPTPRTGDVKAIERMVSSLRRPGPELPDEPGAELVDEPPASVRASEAGAGRPDEATVEGRRAAA